MSRLDPIDPPPFFRSARQHPRRKQWWDEPEKKPEQMTRDELLKEVDRLRGIISWMENPERMGC